MSKQIPLSTGGFAIVDEEDFDALGKWTWRSNGKGYAVRKQYIGKVEGKDKYRSILMHREIMGAPEDMVVHHRNDDILDNQRENLCICTGKQNISRSRISVKNTSGKKGVYLARKKGRWVATIKHFGVKIDLGTYDSLEDAALIYNEAAKKYFGDFARLNELSLTSEEQASRLAVLLASSHLKSTNTSGLRGVSWHKSAKKWSSEIQKDKKRIRLGLFVSLVDAGRAYNEAAVKYFGDKAKLNPL